MPVRRRRTRGETRGWAEVPKCRFGAAHVRVIEGISKLNSSAFCIVYFCFDSCYDTVLPLTVITHDSAASGIRILCVAVRFMPPKQQTRAGRKAVPPPVPSPESIDESCPEEHLNSSASIELFCTFLSSFYLSSAIKFIKSLSDRYQNGRNRCPQGVWVGTKSMPHWHANKSLKV